MDLSIQKLSKAFNQKTVFKDVTFEVPAGSRLAITGPNGAGKSTLLKILSGGALPTSGRITYSYLGKNIPEESIFRYVHFIAPYNTVIEELSLKELFQLHQQLGLLKEYGNFKSWQEKLEYKFDSDVPLKKYSSGMKQRVKLGLALLDDRPLLLLDEPGSNLDTDGKLWLQNLIQQLNSNQTLIIATNDPVEIEYCNNQVAVGD